MRENLFSFSCNYFSLCYCIVYKCLVCRHVIYFVYYVLDAHLIMMYYDVYKKKEKK